MTTKKNQETEPMAVLVEQDEEEEEPCVAFDNPDFILYCVKIGKNISFFTNLSNILYHSEFPGYKSERIENYFKTVLVTLSREGVLMDPDIEHTVYSDEKHQVYMHFQNKNFQVVA